MELGQMMREARLRTGLSIGEIEEMTGIASRYLVDIEEGRDYPYPEAVPLLAAILGLDRAALMAAVKEWDGRYMAGRG